MGTHVVWRTRKGLAPVFALIALLWLQNYMIGVGSGVGRRAFL